MPFVFVLHFESERRQKGMCLLLACMHSAVPSRQRVRMCSVARPSPFSLPRQALDARLE